MKEAISAILGNIFILFFAFALVMTAVKVRRVRTTHRPVNVAYILWGEMLCYAVGRTGSVAVARGRISSGGNDSFRDFFARRCRAAHYTDRAPAQLCAGNAGLVLWFGDIFVPLFVLVLAFLSRDAMLDSP
jgi:hypothetical protein